MLLHFIAATTMVPAMRCIPHNTVRAARAVRMSDTDDMSIPDPNFGNDELSRTWERTGKGISRWKAGDKTGDSALDARLLWSSMLLDPPTLRARDGLHNDSLQAALVLGWLKMPYKIIAYRDDQSSAPGLARKVGSVAFEALNNNDGPLPRLSGASIPGGDDGLVTVLEICSFASGVAKDARIASQTGRADLARWMASEDATIDEFAELLRGRLTKEAPCLNEWGLSMDDAMALPVLMRKIEASQRAPDDLGVRLYVDTCLEKAGLVGLFGTGSE